MKKIFSLLAASVLCMTVNAQRHDAAVVRKAEQGDPASLYKLAEDYYYGFDGGKNESKAVKMYRQAADKGHVNSMFQVGYHYYYDKDDEATATYWFKRAAVNGHPEAAARVGSAYYLGYGVTNDNQRALYWYFKGIEKGDPLSMLHARSLVDDSKAAYLKGAYDAHWKHNKDLVYSNLKKVNEELAENYKNNTESNYWFPDYKQEIIDEISSQGGSNYLVAINNNGGTFSKTAPIEPPIIQIEPGSIEFADASGNKAIDANETCSIRFNVKNIGKGPGNGCIAKIQTSTNGITVKDLKLETIPAGSSLQVEVPVVAGMDIANGSTNFAISVYEPNGFGCDPTSLTVDTHAFVAPMLKITDYAVSNENGSTLKKVDPFDLTFMLQNIEYGTAEDVTVSIELPNGVFMMKGDAQHTYAQLKAGDKKTLSYTLIANNNYTSSTIPVKVNIKEKYGMYSESRTINLAMNQQVEQNSSVVVRGIASNPREDIEIAKIDGKVETADIDLNIPKTNAKNNNTFAVIIANENYDNESKVEYAINDGNSVKNYMQQVLGIPANNIHMVKDATLNNIRGHVDWLKQVAESYEGDASLIFYYAGHGVPDEKSKDAYLLPTDGYGSNMITGYKLDDLYSQLSKYPTKSTLVFLDACFSGSQRNGEMMASARAVGITARNAAPKGNMVVFSAAQGNETAYPYKEKQHGMFTYFMLKKLQETKGNVTLGDLGSYITTNVKRKSVVSNTKRQTPSVQPATNMKGWEKIKLR